MLGLWPGKADFMALAGEWKTTLRLSRRLRYCSEHGYEYF